MGKLDAIVPDLYSLLDEGQEWNPVLDRLREQLSGQSLAIIRADPARGGEAVHSVGLSQWAVNSYRDHFGAIDPVVGAIRSVAVGKATGVRSLLGEKALDSEFFVDWTIPAGCSDTMFMRLPVDGYGVSLAVGRPYDGRRDYSREPLDQVDRLSTHLARVLKARFDREDRDDAMARLLDDCEAMGEAVVIFDRSGNLLWEGGGLDRLALRRADISRKGNRLFLRGRELARGASGVHQDTDLVIRKLDHTGHGFSVVRLFDARMRDEMLGDALAGTYGLTPSECRVALSVRAHTGLQEVAKTLGVSVSTVRVHLQHVFEKTETHRQADLVQLMDQLARGFAPR